MLLLSVVIIACTGFIISTKSFVYKNSRCRYKARNGQCNYFYSYFDSKRYRHNNKIWKLAAVTEPTDTDVTKMEQIIITMSLEKNDETRRQALTNLFTIELSKPEIESQQFSFLFNKCLIEIGDKIRQQAIDDTIRQQQQQQQQQETNLQEATAEEMDNDKLIGSGSVVTAEKSDVELQVWALVDMMVQSKMVAKKIREKTHTENSFG